MTARTAAIAAIKADRPCRFKMGEHTTPGYYVLQVLFTAEDGKEYLYASKPFAGDVDAESKTRVARLLTEAGKTVKPVAP